MKIQNTAVVTGVEGSRFRIIWWHHISFGWPSLIRQFYGGTTDVFTWGRLWIEWLPRSEEGSCIFEVE